MEKRKAEELERIVESLKIYSQLEGLSGAKDAAYPVSGGAQGLGRPKAGFLQELKSEILSERCCHLARTRKNMVFGAGSPDARLVFVGEAPGRDEDIQGEPFVGRAGQLLTKIIESIGLKRSEVYICNILKCRPPNNRNPLPTEIAACEPYLVRQLEIIKPIVICALGKFAAQTLLKTDTPISRLRGEYHDYHGIKLMPTFHPAYLLRNPGEKRTVWEDMKKIRKTLNKAAGT